MTPLQSARRILSDAAKFEPAALVALSGGRDSLATLELVCSSGFERVEAFFMYLVPGLRCVEGPVARACRARGVELHMVEHWDVPRLRRNAVFRFHTKQSDSEPLRKIGDVEDKVRDKTGIRWIAYGHRASDSIARRLMCRSCSGLDVEGRRLYPVWNWLTRDVLSLLKVKGVAPPPRIGSGRMSGLSLDRESMLWLRDNAPADYKRVLLAFPLAGVWEKREEYGEGKTQGGQRRGL